MEKEASKGEKVPSEERREDQTGNELVSQLEELKEKLAKAEVGIGIHQLSMHVKVKEMHSICTTLNYCFSSG